MVKIKKKKKGKKKHWQKRKYLIVYILSTEKEADKRTMKIEEEANAKKEKIKGSGNKYWMKSLILAQDERWQNA